jgi:hypothetical protein
MRRIKMLLAMAAVLVGTLALQAGPAMADDLDCRDANRFEHRFDVDAVNCDGDVFVDRSDVDFLDHGDFFDIDHDFDDVGFLDFDDDFGFASDVDVDFEEVSDDSDLEDECFLTDIEGDGDLEVTCFVEDDDV